MTHGQVGKRGSPGSCRGIARLTAAFAVAAVTSAWMGVGAVSAGEAEDGRSLYAKQCARCHGTIDETLSGALGGGRFLPVVMTPLGPNLTGIYGRPAGAVAGYRYSNAFRKAARGFIWQADSLERWLANSQAMIRGSYMFFKLGQPKRAKIIRYLKAYSRYRGSSG